MKDISQKSALELFYTWQIQKWADFREFFSPEPESGTHSAPSSKVETKATAALARIDAVLSKLARPRELGTPSVAGVCVCVCVRERERERERVFSRERELACSCMCERENRCGLSKLARAQQPVYVCA